MACTDIHWCRELRGEADISNLGWGRGRQELLGKEAGRSRDQSGQWGRKGAAPKLGQMAGLSQPQSCPLNVCRHSLDQVNLFLIRLIYLGELI